MHRLPPIAGNHPHVALQHLVRLRVAVDEADVRPPEGIVVANDLDPARADTVRAALWLALEEPALAA